MGRRGVPILFHAFLAAIPLILVPAPVLAMNGLNLIGFGAESTGMGGADLAVARDTSAMNTNPAGLAAIARDRLDLYGAAAYALNVTHADRLGNDKDVSNRWIGLGSGGYAVRLRNGNVVAGIGVFAQGGSGNVYRDLSTPFGTRDELSSLFRVAKVTPSVAWRPDGGRVSLGASLQVAYADMKQKIFPETSFFNPADPAGSFFGLDVKDLRGISVGAKLGILYRASDAFSVGAAYSPKTTLHLEDGSVVANMSAVGLGKVTYADARAEGFSLPQEAGFGIAFRPVAPLLVAVDLVWIDWSGSIGSTTLRATGPGNPAAPGEIAVTTPQNWRDQYVFATGFAWDVTPRFALRGGYNYGRNPVPRDTTSPLLSAIAEHHVSAGGGYAFSARYRADAALLYTANKKVEYDNPFSPFGPGSREEGESIELHVMLSRIR